MNTELRQILQNELNRRQSANPRYSLRAYARDLGIGVSCISEVLSGKRRLSPKNIVKVLNLLKLSKAEKDGFFESLQGGRNRLEESYMNLFEDEFRLISDWYYLAILSLARMRTNRAEPAWIARRLNISATEAEDALQRLVRLGFIRVENGSMVRLARAVSTTLDIPSAAIRNYHKQTLALAAQSLDTVPVELRDICSVTMPASRKNIRKVKALLLKTRKKVATMLEDPQASDVYTLTIQLFPLTSVSHNFAKTHEVPE